MTAKERQCLLYTLGYYVDNIDGEWNVCCKVATKAFQKDFGLVPTGTVDDATEKAMKHAIAYGMPIKNK